MAQSQGGTVCPECGSAVKPGTQFCGECGAKVPQTPEAGDVTEAPELSTTQAFKPRPKARTVMGIDSQASKFASALAQVEARAKADTDAKKRGNTGSEAEPAPDESAAEQEAEADAKARAEAEAEAEAIIARAQADAQKAYAARDKAAALGQTLALDAASSEPAAESSQGNAAMSSGADRLGVAASKTKTAAFGAVTLGSGTNAPNPAAARSSGGAASDSVDSSGARARSETAAAAAASASTDATSDTAATSETSEAMGSPSEIAASAGDGMESLRETAAAADGGTESPSETAAAGGGGTESPSETSAATSDGSDAGAASASAAAAPAPNQPQPTAAGGPAKPAPRIIVPERGTPAAARAAIQASRRGLSHTMLGLSDEVIKAASSAPPPPASSSFPPSNKDDASPVSVSLPRGITPAPVTTINAAGARGNAASSARSGRSSPKATLLGIQTSPGAISAPGRSLDRTQIEGEQAEEANSGPTYTSSNPGALGSTRVEGTRETALGIGIPAVTPATKRGAPQGRTMLGVPVASISPPPAAAAVRSGSLPARDASSTRASFSDEPASVPPSPPAKVNARTRNVVLLGSLALLTIIAMVYLRLSGGAADADVSAHIMTGPEGETLLFQVPDAREGSSIRFGGQEQPLVAGRATFALASDSLRVGENVVLADVVAPDGETSSARIVLSVFYRIWVDTSGLRVDKPNVDVVVTAVPGTKVTLEGQDVPLDNQGRATKSYPVDITHPGKGGVIDHVVHYRMQPPQGETVVDELHTRIAVAMMQIDRPGQDIVTDRESIEIAGAVGRDTQVDIDGTAVPVKDGHFSHTLQLPRAADYKPRVTAKAPGKIPNAITLSIKRVRDLAQAAREFNFNKDLSYAKIAAEPTLYKGQPIAMEGRVYATVPRAGTSVIQMLARPCPTTQRCSVWVVDPQSTEVSVDRFVRILGIVDGEQQFRSEKNEIVTVPKIIARFVLPAKP